jgi:hypothetical protein
MDIKAQKSNFLKVILFSAIISCNNTNSFNEAIDTTAAPAIDTAAAYSPIVEKKEESLNVVHKYSNVRLVPDGSGSKVYAFLELYGENDYVQVVSLNGFRTSGSGTFRIEGDKLVLTRSRGVAMEGEFQIVRKEDSKVWIIGKDGLTYVQDDDGFYIKKSIETPTFESLGQSSDEGSSGNDESSNAEDMDKSELIYSGTMNDPESGITQDYTLKIRPDFTAASIGGGPYITIEDQGDGSYMWLGGTIIGMSFKPSNNSCIVFGSDGSYFCTLYRQ